MISAWPALVEWTRIHRAGEQRRRYLEAAAATWVEHGCGVSGLLDEVELAEVEAWRQTDAAHALGESLDVAAFIIASRVALQGKARQQQEVEDELAASRRRLQHLLTQSYQEEGRRQVLDGDPRQALPYLMAARHEGETGPSIRMLFPHRQLGQHGQDLGRRGR